MPRLTIDNQDITVADGATILDTAGTLGIHIPTLCHLKGHAPLTTCFLCVVKVDGRDNLLPSCATAAQEGMVIRTQTPEVLAARKTCLELLFSDHAGDCIAPCEQACPAGMHIPGMLRHIAAGDEHQALLTAKRALVLPAVLGRICPAPCEKACRRSKADAAVSIRMLHCHCAAIDLAKQQRFVPECKPSDGRRVAIVGAGPAGLAAAYFLLQEGLAVTIFDQRDLAGGLLRDIDPQRLPRDVIDGEIDVIVRMGLELRMGVVLGQKTKLEDLRLDYDAVVLACGQMTPQQVRQLGLEASDAGIAVDKLTRRTSMDRVFAAGSAVRASQVAVRAVADGHAAAICADQFTRGLPVVGLARPFSCHIGAMQEGELELFLATASPAKRLQPQSSGPCGCVHAQALVEAQRCLRCDCRKADDCVLRRHGGDLGANPRRFKGQRRSFEQDIRHERVIYESGKCIACGRCVQITQQAAEPLGMTFIGRGFSSRVRVPFGEALSAGLTKSADECVANCPTGALAYKRSP